MTNYNINYKSKSFLRIEQKIIGFILKKIFVLINL